MKVYAKIRREGAEGPVIGTRGIDTNNGDGANSDLRSRIVAKYFKIDGRPELCAGTPPLEAFELLFGDVVSNGVG